MRDHQVRRYAGKLAGAEFDDPVYNAVMSAESARSAAGYADVPGYSGGEEGIPVSISMGYYLDRDNADEGWQVQVAVPSNGGGERNVTRYYDDEFTATAVFEWMMATYDLEENYSWDEEEGVEDTDDEDEDEESDSGRLGRLFD